jgi:hypothetical protein
MSGRFKDNIKTILITILFIAALGYAIHIGVKLFG